MPAIVLIPARYASTRFPGKPLCHLFGKPLIQHVYERAGRASRIRDVFVATDSEAIFETVRQFGGSAIMTSEHHQSGTDRIAEAVNLLRREGYPVGAADIIVNVQGDEPMIEPGMVDEVVQIMDDGRASIGTLVRKIDSAEDLIDPNVVKAVFSEGGFALYFSRAPVPYDRDMFHISRKQGRGDLTGKGKGCVTALISVPRPDAVTLYKHIGIYAYRPDVLERLSGLQPSRLERIEKLEQLRALENGLAIKVKETTYETIGVDTPEDLERVIQCLSTSS
ncbi:MAG TPA: 3-deoxy-manno-octulosonate cytidylyltransferase [Dissulfurispiraceae bacterium]|nr:3-deoxy-manno-octulosonate cytidylyltransferase [Dissulfurispiraceae bacterium]